METAYDRRQVVGLDLDRRRSVLVRMTEDGQRLGTARITIGHSRIADAEQGHLLLGVRSASPTLQL